MEVIYTLTRIDLVRFNVYHSARRSFNLVFLVILVALVASSVIRLNLPVVVKLAATVVLALFLGCVFLSATALVALLSYAPSKNRALLGKHRLSIEPEEIVAETDLSTSKWKWASVPKVAQTSRYIFIYVQENLAHVIPKRAFPSPADAQRFFEAADSRWREASHAG